VEGEERVPAVVNVGWRPTFAGTSRTVEAHLIDAGTPDLYGRRLRLAFVARLRGEERFDGVDALVARIRTDVEAARRALAAS
jgi:riboflavin kinase/FMN adenylyltransferase